jgi:hypothetical protein
MLFEVVSIVFVLESLERDIFRYAFYTNGIHTRNA